jgi:hypothetical protein
VTARTRLVSAFVCLVGALAAYQLSYSRGQFSFVPERGFQRVVATDFFPDGPPGSPELPVRFLTYILPPDMKADSVNIRSCDYTLIGHCYIYPAQPQVPADSASPWVPPDTAIYNSSSPYPGAPVGVTHCGFLDGASVVTIAVHPLRYIPARREVYVVSRIEFEFFISEAAGAPRAKVRGICGQRIYDQALKAVIENDNEIPGYYKQPMLIPEQPPESMDRQSFPYPDASEYTIITSDDLASAFQPYADWLTDKGVPACVVRLSEILPYVQGVDDAEKLRNYLMLEYQEGHVIWVLLGGDAGVVPFRYAWSNERDEVLPPGNNSSDVMPCDLYFADMNGVWDSDADSRWGEPYFAPRGDHVDMYPELFVGRLTVRSEEPDKVQNWVNKMLHYETNGSNDLSQFNRATWVYDSVHSERPKPEVRAAFPGYFTHSNYTQVDAPVARNAFGKLPTPGDPTLYAVAGIYNINTHGQPNLFISRYTSVDVLAQNPGPETYDRAGLQWCDVTGDHYVVYSTSCYTAAFDPFVPHPSYVPSDILVADAFTNLYPTTLGIAYLGNTRSGFPGPSGCLQQAFWELLFGTGLFSAPAPSLGVAEGFSKFVFAANGRPACYVNRCHNLFGSPELEPWVMTPAVMVVQAPTTIPKGTPVQFQVHVRTALGVGISGARVCLHKTNDIYQIGWTDSQGAVSFAVQAASTGTIDVTCTRSRGQVIPGPQYLPGRTTCEVTSYRGKGPQSGTGKLPKVLGFGALPSNPVVGCFSVQYGVPAKGRVKLMLCDSQGRVESVLKDGELNPGYYSAAVGLGGRSVPAGVHFLVLAQNGERLTKKLVSLE